MTHPGMPTIEKPDLQEYGASKDGAPQVSNRRLFMQLHVYTGCHDINAIREQMISAELTSVLYQDVNDPLGIGVLVAAEDPNVFVDQARTLLSSPAFEGLTPNSALTMTGRTYSLGREPDLEDWMLKKPIRNVLQKKEPWAVWYPLRRKPEFSLLTKPEQGKILGEHAILGMAYGKAGFAHDVRLACHGLDQNDNEYVIGLLGPELYPLSRIIQDMRKTEQTSKYIQSLGPFFVGRAYWQSDAAAFQ